MIHREVKWKRLKGNHWVSDTQRDGKPDFEIVRTFAEPRAYWVKWRTSMAWTPYGSLSEAKDSVEAGLRGA